MPERRTCWCCGVTFWDASNVDFCSKCYEANCDYRNFFDDNHVCKAELKEAEEMIESLKQLSK